MNDNYRILIIDDNVSIHEDFKKILNPLRTVTESLEKMNSLILGENTARRKLPPFEIDCATQGEMGVALVEKSIDENNPYAMAFVDVQMPPGMDGVETIAKIWKRDLNIQTVICTAYSKYSWEDLQEKFGDTERLLILKKPFDNIEMIQLAIALTRRWNINRAIRKQLTLIRTLPEKQLSKTEDSFEKLKESVEDLSRLTNKMRGTREEKQK